MNMGEMKSKVMMVDPGLAAAWLAKNAQHNRPMRKNTVAGYAQQMQAGQWHLTHQGVAFDVHGALIDGQHRLAAIVQANVMLPMMVTVNAPSVSFESLDCGIKRTVADRLVMNAKLVSVLSAAIRISVDRHRKVNEHEVRALSSAPFGQFASAICEANSTTARVFSSSAVVVAAAAACVEGQDLDWVIEQRRILIVPRYEDNKTRVSEYFRRRFEHERVTTNSEINLEIVACALRVFDPAPWTGVKMNLHSGWKLQVKNRVRAAIGYNEGE
jgi:hypothetical protein